MDRQTIGGNEEVEREREKNMKLEGEQTKTDRKGMKRGI